MMKTYVVDAIEVQRHFVIYHVEATSPSEAAKKVSEGKYKLREEYAKPAFSKVEIVKTVPVYDEIEKYLGRLSEDEKAERLKDITDDG